jgi:anti-sigma-K factor RskA
MAMIDSQNSQQWQELLADYVLGDVTPEEAETVHQLLIAHPELQGEVNRLQETLALLPLALPESSPPKTLKTNILRLAQANPANSILDSFKRRSKLRFFALGSVALSLILGLGFSNYRLYQELALVQADLVQYQQALAALPEPNNRLLSLKGTNDAPTATGVVLIMPNTQKAVMTLWNLTPLPKGQVYRLWAVAKGKKFDCGQFNADKKGQVLMQMPLDNVIINTSTVLVTIEPNGPVSQPTGATVMMGTI